MSIQEGFLSAFSPLPEGVTLPERIGEDYEVESCLACREDGRLVLRLRRRADGAPMVLKITAEDGED